MFGRATRLQTVHRDARARDDPRPAPPGRLARNGKENENGGAESRRDVRCSNSSMFRVASRVCILQCHGRSRLGARCSVVRRCTVWRRVARPNMIGAFSHGNREGPVYSRWVHRVSTESGCLEWMSRMDIQKVGAQRSGLRRHASSKAAQHYRKRRGAVRGINIPRGTVRNNL